MKVKILYRSRTRVGTMLSSISLILRRVSEHVFVIPYVRLEELLPILLMLPLLVLSKSRVIIVSHDVHGLYRNPGIFWKLLTLLRGAYLSCLPNVYIVYVSRYSMVETLLLTKSKCIKSKGFVLYPISKDDIMHQESKIIYVAQRDVVVFSKISKMVDERFWSVLSRCINEGFTAKASRIIVMGGGDDNNARKLVNMLKRYDAYSKVELRLNVPNEIRDQILGRAYLVIYPESMEGLGMPCFEAVMKGTPVLSARRTALIEFVDPSIYSQSKILYPDFCLALKRILEMSPERLYQHVSQLKLTIIKVTLSELKRILRSVSI